MNETRSMKAKGDTLESDVSALLPDPARLPMVDHAEGIYIYDTDGRQYLDGCGGAMTVSIGHGVPEIIAAMHSQAKSVSFVYRTQFTSHAVEALASELVRLAPAGIESAFFVNSGSEATELAMRASLAYWRARDKPRKVRVLGRKISYHGMTMGSLSMSGHALRRADYGGLLHPFPVAPPPYEYRFPLAGPDADFHGAAAWDRILIEEDPETIAAVIVEPIVGAAGGALTPPIGYLKALREICDRHGVLLIVDEVITGLGRTGTWFACQQDGISPDLITCGKGLTSGYTPMGAVLFHDKVRHVLEAGVGSIPFGHTLSNNPLSAAVGLAVLRYMQEQRVLENVARQGARLEDGLRALSGRYPWMADVRGRGLLWGFEILADIDTRAPPDPSLAANALLVSHCFAAGLNVYPAGIAPFNNAILLAPPLTISSTEIDDLLARLEAGLLSFGNAFFGENHGDGQTSMR